jgi:hypothetical protein
MGDDWERMTINVDKPSFITGFWLGVFVGIAVFLMMSWLMGC